MRVGLLLAFALAFGCGRQGALDTVADSNADPRVWQDDAQRIAGALPRAIGPFTPREAADPFWTSYRTGPVFGVSGVYASAGRQLLVRVETGNIAARAAAALDPKAAIDGRPAGRETTVKGTPALVRWSDKGRESEVTFIVARRYLVQLRLVPATNEGETVGLAEGLDLGPLEGLALDGVK